MISNADYFQGKQDKESELAPTIQGLRDALEQAQSKLRMNSVFLSHRQCRIEQLEKQVYLAGHWLCPKCKFYLVSTNLHVPSGGFSANKEPQACANGCGPMWRVTHEQSANNTVDRCDKMQDVIFAAREALLQSHCPHADSNIAMIPARKIGNAINALETAGP